MVYIAHSLRLLKMGYSSPQPNLLCCSVERHLDFFGNLSTPLQLPLEANLFIRSNTNVVKYSCELKEPE